MAHTCHVISKDSYKNANLTILYLLSWDRAEVRLSLGWGGGLLHSGAGTSVAGEGWSCKGMMSHGSLLWMLKSSSVVAGEKVEKQMRVGDRGYGRMWRRQHISNIGT